MERLGRTDAPKTETELIPLPQAVGSLARHAMRAAQEARQLLMSSRNGNSTNGVGRAEGHVAAEDTQEWDALVDEAVQEAVAEERELSKDEPGPNGEDGLFPALIIGPQAYRSPRLSAPDWRLRASEGTEARKAAEQEPPVTVDDKGFQAALNVLLDSSPGEE